MVLVVPPVYHLEIPKGDVADGSIEKAVRHLHRFKSIDGNAGILIELLGDPAADAVNLHAVGFAACHIRRKQTDEIAGAAGRFQKVALLEPHLRQRLVNTPNDHRWRVKCGEGTGSGRCILVLVQQGFEFCVFAVGFLKALRQSAPSHIAGKDFLLLWCGKAFLRFDPFQAADGSDVGGKLFARCAVAQGIVRNVEVAALFSWDFRVQGRKGDALTANPLRSQRSWFFFLGL